MAPDLRSYLNLSFYLSLEMLVSLYSKDSQHPGLCFHFAIQKQVTVSSVCLLCSKMKPCVPQMHSNVKLQIAAIFCISNLVWREEAGSSERQARLRDLGVYKLLQQLIMTSDTLLFDK
jgi:hypothetical protein